MNHLLFSRIMLPVSVGLIGLLLLLMRRQPRSKKGLAAPLVVVAANAPSTFTDAIPLGGTAKSVAFAAQIAILVIGFVLVFRMWRSPAPSPGEPNP
jgi:hypothetical protein